jgi:hypothetical protein
MATFFCKQHYTWNHIHFVCTRKDRQIVCMDASGWWHGGDVAGFWKRWIAYILREIELMTLSGVHLYTCWRIKLVSTYNPQAYGPTTLSPRDSQGSCQSAEQGDC